MSIEIGYIESRGCRSISVTAFDGGDYTGTCVQLNQRDDSVRMDVEAARLMAAKLQEFVDLCDANRDNDPII